MARAKGRRWRRRDGWSTAQHEIVNKVFVYGTLRSGQAGRSMIAPNVASAVSATMTGAIYALPGGPPGFLETGEGTVIGEIVELTDLAAAFALLDAYQGDDFIRLLKLAKLEDGTETYAWTYVLADERIADEGEPILSGDWIKYIKGPYE